jgi:uncharacterized protein YecT (DUF1311 family)
MRKPSGGRPICSLWQVFEARILNASYRALRDSLDDDQRIKLREMQRVWLDARKRSCEFLYVYFQGNYCDNEETARRAIFLIGFGVDAKR